MKLSEELASLLDGDADCTVIRLIGMAERLEHDLESLEMLCTKYQEAYAKLQGIMQ